jgi:hypothetical protein
MIIGDNMSANLYEKAKAIRNWCADNNILYLKADITIPPEIEQEAKLLYEMGLFTCHRISDGKGWSSCTVHGEEWNVTGYAEDKSNYKWTKITGYAPVTTNWLKNVFPNNGKYSRCRFMLLEPGGYIKSHTDTHKWIPGTPLKNDVATAINIAITQPENCYLRRTDDCLEVPFKPLEVHWFNNGCFHEAANFSKEPRFHFIIHGGTNEERVKLFIRSFEKEYPDAIV